MLPYTFFGFTLAIGLSAAQSTTTVSLFLPNTDPQDLVASVIGTDATATTYLISCPPGTDGNNCGYGSGATVIEGPSTLQMVIGGASIACNLAGTTQAVCTESQTLSGFSTTELVTSTLGQADITYFPIGVTGGAEKLGPANTGVSATATSTSGASATTTGLVGSISVAVSSTSGSGSAATKSTTELGGSRSLTTATTSATGSLGISQTQSAATTSASSAAARAGQDQLSMLTTVVGCLVGSILGTTLL